MGNRTYRIALSENDVISVPYLTDETAYADIERRIAFSRRQYRVLAGYYGFFLADRIRHAA